MSDTPRQDKVEVARTFFKKLIEDNNALAILRNYSMVEKVGKELALDRKIEEAVEADARIRRPFSDKIQIRPNCWILLFTEEYCQDTSMRFAVVSFEGETELPTVMRSQYIYNSLPELLAAVAVYTLIGREDSTIIRAIELMVRGVNSNGKMHP